MIRVLFDTNILLDVLLDRQPFVGASQELWAAIEERKAEAFISAHAVTTIHYFLAKAVGNARAKRSLGAILSVFQAAAIDGSVVQSALQAGDSDFEYAVSAAAAHSQHCDYIVTRNLKGFRKSPVPAVTPGALLAMIYGVGFEDL